MFRCQSPPVLAVRDHGSVDRCQTDIAGELIDNSLGDVAFENSRMGDQPAIFMKEYALDRAIGRRIQSFHEVVAKLDRSSQRTDMLVIDPDRGETARGQCFPVLDRDELRKFTTDKSAFRVLVRTNGRGEGSIVQIEFGRRFIAIEHQPARTRCCRDHQFIMGREKIDVLNLVRQSFTGTIDNMIGGDQ